MENFEILDRNFGKGAFGVCLKAKNIFDGVVGCLKVFEPVANSESKDLIEKELNQMNQMVHQNIIKPYETFWQDDHLCNFMELIPNGNISQFCSFPQPEEKIIQWGRQIARGLAVLHINEFVHYNLKPANILITNENAVKISDFSFYQNLDKNFETLLAISDTIPYLAPELYLHQKPDFQSDVYNFGVILYELAAGKLPFELTSVKTSKTNLHIKAPPPLPSTISGELSHLIFGMLEKNPKKRKSLNDVLHHPLFRLESSPETKLFNLKFQINESKFSQKKSKNIPINQKSENSINVDQNVISSLLSTKANQSTNETNTSFSSVPTLKSNTGNIKLSVSPSSPPVRKSNLIGIKSNIPSSFATTKPHFSSSSTKRELESQSKSNIPVLENPRPKSYAHSHHPRSPSPPRPLSRASTLRKGLLSPPNIEQRNQQKEKSIMSSKSQPQKKLNSSKTETNKENLPLSFQPNSLSTENLNGQNITSDSPLVAHSTDSHGHSTDSHGHSTDSHSHTHSTDSHSHAHPNDYSGSSSQHSSAVVSRSPSHVHLRLSSRLDSAKISKSPSSTHLLQKTKSTGKTISKRHRQQILKSRQASTKASPRPSPHVLSTTPSYELIPIPNPNSKNKTQPGKIPRGLSLFEFRSNEPISPLSIQSQQDIITDEPPLSFRSLRSHSPTKSGRMVPISSPRSPSKISNSRSYQVSTYYIPSNDKHPVDFFPSRPELDRYSHWIIVTAGCEPITYKINLDPSRTMFILLDKNVDSIFCSEDRENHVLESVIIKHPLKHLGKFTFMNFFRLSLVTFPSSIISLGNNCFFSCTSLKRIVLPSNLKELGGGCFSFCSSLVSVEITSSVGVLNWGCFSHCFALSYVLIPRSVSRINSSSFYNCPKLFDSSSSGGRFQIESGSKFNQEMLRKCNVNFIDGKDIKP